MGKLIVIEGTDGSGKSTQFKLLTARLEVENHPFQKLVFPQYAEPSSALIRMYLGGEFGKLDWAAMPSRSLYYAKIVQIKSKTIKFPRNVLPRYHLSYKKDST